MVPAVTSKYLYYVLRLWKNLTEHSHNHVCLMPWVAKTGSWFLWRLGLLFDILNNNSK